MQFDTSDQERDGMPENAATPQNDQFVSEEPMTPLEPMDAPSMPNDAENAVPEPSVQEVTGSFESKSSSADLAPKKNYTGKFSAAAKAMRSAPMEEPSVSDPSVSFFAPESAGLPELDAGSPDTLNSSGDFGAELVQDASDATQQEYAFSGISDQTDGTAEAPKKKKRRAVKKGRPKRRKGEGLLGIPNILVTVVWCALIMLISVTLGRMAWICASEVLAFGREDRTVTITIYENDTIDTITKKLAREGLIHYPGLFKLYAQFAVDDGDIHPGIWDLNTKYDYHALVRMMSPSSSRDVVKVMIPEGYSCRQIFALLEQNKVCTIKDISTYAETGELGDYWFLEGVVRDNKYCLEGFLFPDTYEFYQNDTPKSVLTKMLNNFEKRFDATMQAQIQTLNNTLADLMRRDGRSQDYINSNLFTVRDVVNVASMIEKETANAEEAHKIASVIYNRLFYWHGTPPYLNIDATIIYALDGKTDLTSEDLRVDSPYNTYTHQGLTPGPISNPGLSSLKAALTPENTQYYFYVLDPASGTHIFATTQAEHDANRAKVGG